MPLAKRNPEYPPKKIAIFDAAINLIAEDGFKSPTAKIAEEAGVGTGTIYRYFESKDDLINELMGYVEEKLNRAVTQDDNPDKPVKEQFIRLCKNIIHFSFENPRAFNFFNQYIDSPYGTVLRKYKRSRDAGNIPKNTLLFPFYMLFNKSKEQNLIKDMPNAILFTLIYGSISHFIRDVRIGLIDYSEEIEEKVVEACWDTIRN
jgi:AcrR family transcriptional regulator